MNKLKKVISGLCLLFVIFEISGCSRDEIIYPSLEVNTSKGAYVLCEGSLPDSTPGFSLD